MRTFMMQVGDLRMAKMEEKEKKKTCTRNKKITEFNSTFLVYFLVYYLTFREYLLNKINTLGMRFTKAKTLPSFIVTFFI